VAERDPVERIADHTEVFAARPRFHCQALAFAIEKPDAEHVPSALNLMAHRALRDIQSSSAARVEALAPRRSLKSLKRV